jgi:hypothetical protein
MKKACLCALLALGSIGSAATITSGTASFMLGDTVSSFDTSPTANFTFGGVDHLFEWGWWSRGSGDAQEFALSVPIIVAAGNQMTLTWSGLPGGLTSVSGTLVLTLVENSANLATLDAVFTLTNNNQVSETINLFNMADIDLQPTAGDDQVSGGLSGIIVTHASNSRAARFSGLGASAFLVRAFGGSDVGVVLSDGILTNFDNSGIPFGPGDMTSGFQWTSTIGAGQSAVFASRLEIALDGNLPQDPGNGVPEPSTYGLIGAGLAGIAFLRRR